MKEYFKNKGYEGIILSYNSKDGVVSSSNVLDSYLKKLTSQYLNEGTQIKKFNIVAHSMGGLVARYYTCDKSYIMEDNINKLIFISVPHKGTSIASVGEHYYNDQSIKDLAPGNVFISKTLPSKINKGLNPHIQTGNILGQYDEVVTPDNASLDAWNIKTELFNIGDSNFSFNNLINGNILEAVNHKIILTNKKVFERVYEMISKNISYPALISD
jgi:uncharacterized alpha/beta hydrolase family protein